MIFEKHLVDTVFKKNELGKMVFYPRGILGKGIILETEEQYLKFRSFYKKMFLLALSVFFIDRIFGFLYALIFSFLYLCWYEFKVRKMAKGLSYTSVRLINQNNKNRPLQIFLLILCILMTSALIALFLDNMPKSNVTFNDLWPVIFFGITILGYIFLIFIKIKNKT